MCTRCVRTLAVGEGIHSVDETGKPGPMGCVYCAICTSMDCGTDFFRRTLGEVFISMSPRIRSSNRGSLARPRGVVSTFAGWLCYSCRQQPVGRLLDPSVPGQLGRCGLVTVIRRSKHYFHECKQALLSPYYGINGRDLLLSSKNDMNVCGIVKVSVSLPVSVSSARLSPHRSMTYYFRSRVRVSQEWSSPTGRFGVVLQKRALHFDIMSLHDIFDPVDWGASHNWFCNAVMVLGDIF